jgi:pimeloyl-ACP methyl ester carboxylesterase
MALMHKQLLDLQPYRAAYFEQGEGPALLFLHGFLGTGSAWLPVFAYLSQRRCIALDLLGFGDSAKPELRYTIWDQVAFVQQVVAALGLSRFWLVGHSYGGWTAAAYAIACAQGRLGLPQQQRPMSAPLDALAGISLIAPAGIRDDQFVGRYAHLRPLLWSGAWVDLGLAMLKPVCGLLGQANSFAEILQAREALQAQPVAKSFLRDRLRPEDAIDTLEQDLNCIQVPALVIAGEQDTTIPLWHCQTYASGIAEAEYICLPNAGHGLLQTHPAVIAEQLLAITG